MSGSLSCTICSENYKNSDEIYTTSCGHVYHFICMQRWQSRSESCPECRTYKPQTHRIYLTFEETDNEQKSNNLKKQLDQSVMLGSELQQQLEKSEKDFEEMHRQYSISETERTRLDEAIKYLEIQNESRGKENAEKQKKIEELLVKSRTHITIEQETELRDEITSLKRNLQKSNLDLENEIDNSTKLRQEKVALEAKDLQLQKCLDDSEERLREKCKELGEQEKIIEKLILDIEKLEGELKQKADAAKQYETVEAALKMEIQYLTKEINCKNREIDIHKKYTLYQNTTATTAVDEKIIYLECKLKEALEKERKCSSEGLINKMKLERQLEESKAKIADLEESIRKAEQISKLNIEKLTMDNKKKSKEIVKMVKENQELLEKMSKLVSTETEMLLRERIAALNKKLDEAWNEIESKSKFAVILAQEKLKIQLKMEENEKVLEKVQEKCNKDLEGLRNKISILESQNEVKQKQIDTFKNEMSRPDMGTEEKAMLLKKIAELKRKLHGNPVQLMNLSQYGVKTPFHPLPHGLYPAIPALYANSGIDNRRGYKMNERSTERNNVFDNERLFVFDAQNATQEEMKSVVIKGIPNKYMGGHPIDVVVKFAQVLDVNCTKADIEEAFILESFTTKSSLVVKFKKLDLKVDFLVNKQKLRSEGIFINEFVDKEVHLLFQHAKSLKSAGYHSVFCKNNTVFVRKTANSTPLRIDSNEEVDKLAEAAKQSVENLLSEETRLSFEKLLAEGARNNAVKRVPQKARGRKTKEKTTNVENGDNA